eukprot:TRINITY_DN52187_c0_g1_i1.p1 TRINITY_DN52187_c0_g1~~TRINITY_DN52187_c0_g1_i1.p1  ORF type:complete len:369 (+),score=82.09 TRINITY_DN52187_c0_g1_i1:46-1152(+)
MDDAEVEVKLSKGQKKKLKQRRLNQAQDEVQAKFAQSQPQEVKEVKETGSDVPIESDSSQGTPSEFSSSQPPSEDEAGMKDEDASAPSAPSALSAKNSGYSLAGWTMPKGRPPPRWPPEGAELLTEHSDQALAAAMRRRILRLAALSSPQPKDKLQWRILPLVRKAIGSSDEALPASEIIRFVRGNLPAECLATVSENRLGSLVNLVISRNLRLGHLVQSGKRYSLPLAEDPSIFIPLLDGSGPVSLWVAWSTDSKLPREAALRYSPSCLEQQTPGDPRAAVWLCARFKVSHRGNGVKIAEPKPWPDADEITLSGTKAWISNSENSFAVEWWDRTGSMLWTLSTPSSLPSDLALELAQQCQQQQAAER